MKFGKELRDEAAKRPHQRNHFLNYKELKRVVKNARQLLASDELQGERVYAAKEQFLELLRHQLDKVNNFVELQWEVLTEEFKAQFRQQITATSTDELRLLAEELVALERFVRANFEGFRKITKKYDKHCHTTFSESFMSQVECASFRQCDFDASLRQLGQLYVNFHHAQGASASQPAPASCEERAEVFILPHHCAMAVKVALVQHSSLHMSSKDSGRQLLLHSLYLEGAAGEQFRERFRRYSRAIAEQAPSGSVEFSFRWEQVSEQNPDLVYLATRNVCNERLQVPMSLEEASDLLEGRLEPTALLSREGANERALKDVGIAIRDHKLSAMLGASFRRLAFFAAGSDSEEQAAACLDEDIKFSDEFHSFDQGPLFRSWRSRRSASHSDRLQVASPVAILYFRVSPAPELRQRLLDMGVQQVPFFSKGMAGMLLLHQGFLRDLPGGRHPEFKLENLLRPKEAQMPQAPSRDEHRAAAPEGAESCKRQRHEAGQQSAALGPVMGSAVQTARRWMNGPMRCVDSAADLASGACDGCLTARDQQELRVDCKVPLAIERTVLRWFRSAVLLSSLSAYLLSSQVLAEQLNGFLLAGLAVLFVFWPLNHFYRRSLEISKPSASGQPETDRTLPQALSVCLITILASVLVVQAILASDSDDDDPSASQEQ